MAKLDKIVPEPVVQPPTEYVLTLTEQEASDLLSLLADVSANVFSLDSPLQSVFKVLHTAGLPWNSDIRKKFQEFHPKKTSEAQLKYSIN
jgi:hypothetical protein